MPPTIVLVFGCIAVVLCFDASRSRFERFLEWVFAPWPLWFGVSSALVVMMLFRHTLIDHKQAFERAGLLLQVLGILAVVDGASQKLEALGKRGWRGLFGD